ncbi:protein FAM217A-like [Candoia aspera]|uniref:protein FAM217A-like n=1 Tax=Candoia aspera TaxID=51853 RepID=UPI002FD7EAE0
MRKKRSEVSETSQARRPHASPRRKGSGLRAARSPQWEAILTVSWPGWAALRLRLRLRFSSLLPVSETEHEYNYRRHVCMAWKLALLLKRNFIHQKISLPQEVRSSADILYVKNALQPDTRRITDRRPLLKFISLEEMIFPSYIPIVFLLKMFCIFQLNSNSSKQGQFHSRNNVPKQGNNSVSRDFSKPCAEMPSTSSDVPRNVIHTNPLVQSFLKRHHPVSYPGTKKTASEKKCRDGDGDFPKRTKEATTTDSSPARNSSGDDVHLANKWKVKKRNDNVERKLLAEEKAAAETKRRNKALLEKLKNVNLNLKPDPFEHQEDDVPSSSAENDTFPYPDFLPSPYNNLNLKKLSLSKSDDWKSSIKPPLNASLNKLVSRLVQMERLQHATILRERANEATCPAVAANNRTILTKEVPQSKQPRPLDCCQVKRDGDTSCGGQQTDVPKCQQSHNHKNPAPSMHSSSTMTRASCSNVKSNKTPAVLSSTNVAARPSLSCSGSSSKICPDVTLNSTNVDSSSTTAACSLPDSESSKNKQTKTKKKDLKKRGSLTSRPSQSQKLKSVSLNSKQKSSSVDPQ